MTGRFCLIGLDPPEYQEVRARLGIHALAYETVPRIVVRDGELFVESLSGSTEYKVSRVVFHGIFADDFDLLAGLALWGGPTLPDARAMMDCRLKIPCLVRALRFTRFGAPARGFASAGARFDAPDQRVAKWGNWHCGENKHQFSGTWYAEESSIVEPFFAGEAVRIVMIGRQFFQLRLAGDGWLKSIHHPDADFMDLDPDLCADTLAVARGFGLEILANDYIVAPNGERHLLEVNHCPNVTRFGEIRKVYLDYVTEWLLRQDSPPGP